MIRNARKITSLEKVKMYFQCTLLPTQSVLIFLSHVHCHHEILTKYNLNSLNSDYLLTLYLLLLRKQVFYD